MKKRKILLLGAILSLCVVVGFTTNVKREIPIEKTHENTNESSILIEDGEIENLNQDEENVTQNETTQINSQENAEKATDIAQQSETSSSTEISNEDFISAEDKAVKSEISKYVETKVDFRLNRQEMINQKTFNLTFSEIENDEKVVYKNELEDVFKYDAKSGKLREVIINSVVTQKTNESIDENAAQKITIEYAKTKYETDAYKLYSCKETTKGYNYIYTRYIGGYPSSDKFSIKVGYDGNIVYVSDFTDTFDSKELNYSKEFIDSKIKAYSDETKVDWNSITICLYEGKVAVKYTEAEQCAIAILPLE